MAMDVKPVRGKRESVVPRTPKNYQKVSAKISALVSIEVERAGLFVNMELNYPTAL
jgi:hypothetical protein